MENFVANTCSLSYVNKRERGIQNMNYLYCRQQHIYHTLVNKHGHSKKCNKVLKKSTSTL